MALPPEPVIECGMCHEASEFDFWDRIPTCGACGVEYEGIDGRILRMFRRRYVSFVVAAHRLEFQGLRLNEVRLRPAETRGSRLTEIVLQCRPCAGYTAVRADHLARVAHDPALLGCAWCARRPRRPVVARSFGRRLLELAAADARLPDAAWRPVVLRLRPKRRTGALDR